MFNKLQYFTLHEFLYSETALSKHIDNAPQDFEIITNIHRVAAILDEIRASLKMPIHVNSGFRSRKLNSSLPGHSNTSRHLYGLAADITCRDNTRLYAAIAKYCGLSEHIFIDRVAKNDKFELIYHPTYIHFGILK